MVRVVVLDFYLEPPLGSVDREASKEVISHERFMSVSQEVRSAVQLI